jgi:hypothetical protein
MATDGGECVETTDERDAGASVNVVRVLSGTSSCALSFSFLDN